MKLPGTSGLFKKRQIVEKKCCPRQRSCPGQVASSKKIDFLPTVLPQAAKLPGTSGVFKKKIGFLRKSSAPGSEAARDKWFVQKKNRFLRKNFCPRQRSCPGQVVCSEKSQIFDKTNLPQAAKLPKTSGLFKKKHILRKSSAPGSEAARDKWSLQKESDF